MKVVEEWGEFDIEKIREYYRKNLIERIVIEDFYAPFPVIIVVLKPLGNEQKILKFRVTNKICKEFDLILRKDWRFGVSDIMGTKIYKPYPYFP